MSRRGLMCLVGLATLYVVVHALLASRLGSEEATTIIDYMWVEIPIYVAAVLVVLLDKGPDPRATRRAFAGILVVAAILRIMVVPMVPVSTDINRYIWDGRVQAAGINPYRYIPADPALKNLRDTEIYPDINRKDYAPTIYPPFAQIIFYLVTRFGEDVTVMKVAMTAFDVIAIWALCRLLALRGLPPTRILLYAWHPVPIWEFAGDGHVDVVAVACICLALLAVQTRRPILAGIALGGATLTKFFPVIIGPALYRRWDWKLPLAGLATVVLLYLPYVGAGKKVFGFLSAYSVEEGFKDGWGAYPWLLLKHIVPIIPQGAFAFYIPCLAFVLAGIGIRNLLRDRSVDLDMMGAFLIATVFTVATSPHYIWYLAWLVPFLCFYASPSVMWLTVAATFMNNVGWPHSFEGGTPVFGPFFLIAAVEVTLRYLRTKKGDHGNAVPAEAG